MGHLLCDFLDGFPQLIGGFLVAATLGRFDEAADIGGVGSDKLLDGHDGDKAFFLAVDLESQQDRGPLANEVKGFGRPA